MKIKSVRANNRKHLFELTTRSGDFVFPYSECSPLPSADDPISDVYVDPELANEAITYVLRSGAEGAVHIDWALEYNEDPGYLADLALYRLTTEALKRMESSSLSIREIARRLGTSPPQLYRLLDTTNYNKSMKQMLALLYVLGLEVNVEIRERPRAAPFLDVRRTLEVTGTSRRGSRRWTIVRSFALVRLQRSEVVSSLSPGTSFIPATRTSTTSSSTAASPRAAAS